MRVCSLLALTAAVPVLSLPRATLPLTLTTSKPRLTQAPKPVSLLLLDYLMASMPAATVRAPVV